MLSATLIGIAALAAGYFAFSKRLAASSNWKATVTPLASIMGSGFLVSAPLLAGVAGNLAIFCMAGLLLLAYGVGGAIRFNIRHFEPIEHGDSGPAQKIGFLSRVILALAYLISITYYLQLLSAFFLNALGVEGEIAANAITTLLLFLIGGIGMIWGLERLESVERYAVAVNLGIIASLLIGLVIYNVGLTSSASWSLPEVSSTIDLSDVRILLGLLIVVQGFETSRYLGAGHPAEQRIATMRTAQLISAAIYLSFIGLVTVLFHDGLGTDVTAIIGMTAPVAMVLPLMLSIAAIGSQFSAAVADNAGAGGLLEDITVGKLPIRYAYLLILCVTVVLTWETNVNAIIAYASRAFALYYTLQCVVAIIVARSLDDGDGRWQRQLRFGLLALLCGAVFLFGLPSE